MKNPSGTFFRDRRGAAETFCDRSAHDAMQTPLAAHDFFSSSPRKTNLSLARIISLRRAR